MDFRLDEVAARVSGSKARVVAVQMPEGLKPRAQEVAAEIRRRTGAEVVILAEPCYGACDLDVSALRFADLLVHFGHAPMPSEPAGPDALFVPVACDMDLSGLLREALPRLSGKVGLVATAQHAHQLVEVRGWLQERGVDAVIAERRGRIAFDGQVLGCDVSATVDDADVHLYVGGGDFHPMAVSIATRRPVVVLDPFMNEVRDVAEKTERMMRQRHAAITKASEGRRFLILASRKIGQDRLELAMSLRAMVEDKGRAAEVAVLDRYDPELLIPYQADAYVSTACPRIALDDAARYKKPMLTPPELEIALGLRRWDEYRMDALSDRGGPA